jgi:gas vesicle protein
MSDNSSEFGAFLAGFVMGGLVGAATALILAPQSGQETRSQLASKGNELRHAGEEQVRHYREVADTYTHEYRDRAEELATEVEEQARIVLDAGKEQAQQVQEDLTESESEDHSAASTSFASGENSETT